MTNFIVDQTGAGVGGVADVQDSSQESQVEK